jgi:hypothetical protein
MSMGDRTYTFWVVSLSQLGESFVSKKRGLNILFLRVANSFYCVFISVDGFFFHSFLPQYVPTAQ